MNAAGEGPEYEIVVLGGGFAGGHFIAEYIEKGGSGTDICLVSAEGVYPYDRPFLTKGFLRTAEKLAEHHTASKTKDWYNAHGITVLLNSPCTKVDIKNKTLFYCDKDGLPSTVSWRNGFVIATGSKAAPDSIPGILAPGCHKLLNYTDGLSLRNTLEKCRGGKAVVLGGECLHMDIIVALTTSWDMSVTCVLEEPRLFPALFTKEISKVYEDKLEEMGVDLHRETAVTQVTTKDSEVSGVQLSNKKRVECDVLIYGNCAMPNIDLFGDQLEYINEPPGIQVDENMCTSVEGVYAIGEVAVLHINNKEAGISQTIKCADQFLSKMMATHLAAVLTGVVSRSPYMYFPDFHSSLYDMKWRFFGLTSPDCTIEYLLTEPHFFVVWIKDDKLVAAFVEGRGDTEMELVTRQAVKMQVNLQPGEMAYNSPVKVFVKKILRDKIRESTIAREEAVLTVPVLNMEIEQASYQVERALEQVQKLKRELTNVLEAQQTFTWFTNHILQKEDLSFSVGYTGGENVVNSVFPEIQNKVPFSARAAAYTLLNAFTFTGTQFLFYREVFVMHPFPYLTSLVNAVLSFAISGVLLLALQRYSDHSEMQLSALLTLPMKPLMVLGILFAITNVIQVAAIDALGPSNVNVATLLNQFTVPFTAIGGYLLYKSPYKVVQLMGSLLMVGGLAVFSADGPTDISTGKYVAWIVMYSITCLVQTCFDIVTQKFFGEATRPVTMLDVLYLVFFMNLGSVLLAPLVSILFGSVATTDVSTLMNEDYGDGMVCLFTGNTSSSRNFGGSGDWWLTTQCEYAWVWVLGFNLSSVLYCLISTLILMKGGTTAQFFTQLIALPVLNALLGSDTLMGGHAGSLSGLLWASVAMFCVGLLIHEHGNFMKKATDEERASLLCHARSPRSSVSSPNLHSPSSGLHVQLNL